MVSHGTADPEDRVEGKESRSVNTGWELGGSDVLDRDDEGRDNELTPDQTGKCLDDPAIPLTCERALLDLCFHPV